MSSTFDAACQFIDLAADTATLAPAGPAVVRIVAKLLPGTIKKRGEQYLVGTLGLLEKHAVRLPRELHIEIHSQYDDLHNRHLKLDFKKYYTIKQCFKYRRDVLEWKDEAKDLFKFTRVSSLEARSTGLWQLTGNSGESDVAKTPGSIVLLDLTPAYTPEGTPADLQESPFGDDTHALDFTDTVELDVLGFDGEHAILGISSSQESDRSDGDS